MHILLVNDDGPPSNQSSPYVHTLVETLQQAGHKVSVVLPNVQRSWIGKAHLVGQSLTPSYFRPGTLLKDDGRESPRPFNDGGEEWILLDGTPASCVQIGLHHMFNDKAPFDLILSGPNYGRNTTAVFALSSGTLGAAMEGAINGRKSIALSYAFDSREHDLEIIKEASLLSTKLIEKLVKEWPADVHLYSINVPLRKGVTYNKILFTEMIQNTWKSGSTYDELPESATDTDPQKEEHQIREGDQRNGEISAKSRARNHVTYKWAPKFVDVKKAVEDAREGDGWEVLQGNVSVTPLRANFWHLPQYHGEIKLSDDGAAHSLRGSVPPQPHIHALVEYPEPYVQPLIVRALEQLPTRISLVRSPTELNEPKDFFLQFTAYESIDFEHGMQHPFTSLMCAYVIRKALIRKHFLSNTISTWLVKHPESVLSSHFKPCVHFELDYAEFLDEALVDAWDLNESMTRNEQANDTAHREWWILKPGMSDGGNGLRIFSSLAELQAIFEEWDEAEDESEDEAGDEAKAEDEDADGTQDAANHLKTESAKSTHGTMTSQLRHFIAQPYIDNPLLLSSYANRKFHIRAYVLAVGALRVYVYREMLALFAEKPYIRPGDGSGPVDLTQHLTNTCFQDDSTKSTSVHRFWTLESETQGDEWKQKVFAQICNLTGEVFEAAAKEQMVHFQTLPNAFEIFGVDFLVDEYTQVWLLELNAYPDFKQTGKELQDLVVGGLFEEIVKVAVAPFFGLAQGTPRVKNQRMPLVKEIVTGRH